MILIYDSTLEDAHSITIMYAINAHLTIPIVTTANRRLIVLAINAKCQDAFFHNKPVSADFEYKLARKGLKVT